MQIEITEDVFRNFEQKSHLYQRLNWAFGNSMSARPHGAGRPARSESKRLAIVVANFYFNLSGRRPTVTRDEIIPSVSQPWHATWESGGEFYNLLDFVFKILEVEDHPRTAVEFVRKHWHAIDKAPGSVARIEHILPLCGLIHNPFPRCSSISGLASTPPAFALQAAPVAQSRCSGSNPRWACPIYFILRERSRPSLGFVS